MVSELCAGLGRGGDLKQPAQNADYLLLLRPTTGLGWAELRLQRKRRFALGDAGAKPAWTKQRIETLFLSKRGV